MEKHPCLPNLEGKDLAIWLENHSVNTFTDKDRTMFTPEEIQEFEHESSLNGREFNRLGGIKSLVSDLLRKGTDEERTIVIPKTVGTKMLELQRRQNDDFIEAGYAEEEVQVFQVPDFEAQTWVFVDRDGKAFADRERGFTMKEKNEYANEIEFASPRSLKVVTEKNGDIVNPDTGEVLGNDSVAV